MSDMTLFFNKIIILLKVGGQPACLLILLLGEEPGVVLQTLLLKVVQLLQLIPSYTIIREQSHCSPNCQYDSVLD